MNELLDTPPVDLWAELQRAGEVPPASADALVAARDGVRRAATAVSLLAARGRKRRRRARIGVLVAGSVAASVVFGLTRFNVGGHDVGTPSAAAAVLDRAARVTLAQSDPQVGPGQYLRITLVEQGWGTYGDQDGGTLRGADGRLAVEETRRTRTLWIPYDKADAWTVRDGTVLVRSNTSDPAYRGSDEPTTTSTTPSWSTPGTRSYIETYDPLWYAGLPRDPQKLLAALRAGSTAEGSGTAYDFQEIYSEVLRSGVAPAEIRAALFEGLADTPGMRVQTGVATLDGRRGVAIGYRTGHWQMVFDAETGLYIGERATSPDFPAVPGLDADRTTWLTSVRTEVVDRAPHPR